jgi:hypothetical protein
MEAFVHLHPVWIAAYLLKWTKLRFVNSSVKAVLLLQKCGRHHILDHKLQTFVNRSLLEKNSKHKMSKSDLQPRALKQSMTGISSGNQKNKM